MLFLSILVATTAVAAVAGRRRSSWRDHARRGLAAAMAFAGISHLAQPDPFLQHLPDWVPAAGAVVAATGLIEIAIGAALVSRRLTRETVGRWTAVYLLAVFPANVYVAVASVNVEGQPGGVFRWIRLPLQALFIAWALWSTRPATVAAPVAAPREQSLLSL
jgi:uncharacterized membrane protein